MSKPEPQTCEFCPTSRHIGVVGLSALINEGDFTLLARVSKAQVLCAMLLDSELFSNMCWHRILVLYCDIDVWLFPHP
jgi:hypothetical protein